jgi:(1->4)-alpha-D-glucan 1-alpha-D-glucosylmutase
MSDALNRLCEQAGIHTGYHDIWGRWHVASDETRRVLLQALGLIDTAQDDLEQASQRIERRQSQEALPAVHVTQASQAFQLACHLASSSLARVHTWRIRLEDGDTRTGDFHPADLERASSSVDGTTISTVMLPLPALDATGYHHLELLQAGRLIASCTLIVCPTKAYLPASFDEGGRHWGLAVQLYSLHSQSNWGLGDFSDLGQAIDWAAQAGADLVGVNPLHALFPHNPDHCSPYSPSSRQFLNVLHIDVEAIPEFTECADAQARMASVDFHIRLDALRQAELIDYAGVAQAKFDVLALLYRHFRDRHLTANSPRAQDFRSYQAEGGEELQLFGLYHALQEHFFAQDRTMWGWLAWPEAFQRHASPEVAEFAANHTVDIEWHVWLQWLADRQLGEAADKAARNGMAIGLYQDLAVGVDKGGAETWMHRDMYALDCRIGCPPDDFNLLGQDWGLPPWVPHKLRAAAYEPYIAMLRANMKHAGALRIDHVMGLMRLYWIPPGMKGDAGAYLAYPFRDLLGILALESQRNRCLIVGEDLGTVPDEVRHALGDLGVLTYRLFYFERQQDGHFMPPPWYPRQALVAATTHDLPTLAGYWQGRDIEVRTELHQFPSEEVRQNQIEGRRLDRIRLLEALAHEGLLPEGLSINPDDVPELTPALRRSILRYVARTPSYLALMQAEDMVGQIDQANLPGTVDEHPNWRRKLSLPLERWQADADCRNAGQAMTETRSAA